MPASPPAPATATADTPDAATPAGSTKAERTREALRAAALRRFVADGFDGASVADIAADVGVTERTFYRHFATKDEVLFGDFEQRLGWFRDALDERPPTESLVASCAAALSSFPDDPRLMIEVAKLRESLLSRDRIARFLRELQGLLADELRRVADERRAATRPAGRSRRRPDRAGERADRAGERADRAGERAETLLTAVQSEVLSAAVFAAVRVWTDERGDRSLTELALLTDQALDLVRPAFDP